jgi:hypothetical protein
MTCCLLPLLSAELMATSHHYHAASANYFTYACLRCAAHWQAYTEGKEPQQLSTVTYKTGGTTFEADFTAMTQQRTGGRFTAKRAAPIRRVAIEVNRQLTLATTTSNTSAEHSLHSLHALVASEPLQWVTQPTAVAAPPQLAAAAAATAAAAAGAPIAAVSSSWKNRKPGGSSSHSSRISVSAAAAAATGNAASSSSSVGAAAAAADSAGGSSTSTATATATAVYKYELHRSAALTPNVTLESVMFSLASAQFKRGSTGSGRGSVQQVDVYSTAVTRAKYDAKRQQFAAQGISTAETWVFHGTKTTDNVHSIMTEGFKVCAVNYCYNLVVTLHYGMQCVLFVPVLQ